ncbi:MAG: hypothetical protein N2578_06215, partial [Bdellovibrionaceae bacterium]|nr:hypothetical protein [Pseudobdellovibrionaceae bacterium]
MKRFFVALLASAGLHLLLTLGLLRVPSFPRLEHQSSEAAEIDLVDENNKLFVRFAPAPEEQISEDEQTKARFKSAVRQRVIKETRTARSGLTQNTSGPAPGSWIENMQRRPQSNKRDDAEELKVSPGWDNVRHDFAAIDSMPGPSMTGEALPQDVAIGSFNAVSYTHLTLP